MNAEMANNVGRKPVWHYPKVAGFNPPERWGHSACYYDGVLYVFGGCCGGLHFSDVVTLDLKTMAWSSLETGGERPGTRDSHSAVVLGEKMIMFGGTNGSNKVNDLHILNLRSREWTRPAVQGKPPSPRESHSATLIGDGKVAIFGGSGEGEGNYLNDVHILDLKAMKWSSPEVSGELPARRDSHTAAAIGSRLVVYGGDCGDHYLGEVDVLDLATFTWSRLVVQGSSSPGVRAGHATVGIGSKVYVIGGVGDRTYYNDTWMLDINACSWIQLDVAGQQPQGRFSHTAVLAGYASIVIYGGCGEDERPLDEIIFLQLEPEDANGALFNVPVCNIFGKQCSQDAKARFPGSLKGVAEQNGPTTDIRSCSEAWKDDLKRFADAEAESKTYSSVNPESRQQKRMKKLWSRRLESELEQDQQSHAPSEQSNSPPQSSDPDQMLRSTKVSAALVSRPPHTLGIFCQPTPTVENSQRQQQYGGNVNVYHHSAHVNAQLQNPKVEQHFIRLPAAAAPAAAVQLHVHVPHQAMTLPANNASLTPPLQSFPRDSYSCMDNARRSEPEAPEKCSVVTVPNLVGAEVRGAVDGVFDSGYLMTAQVNGQLFRGLLFSPGPGVVARELNTPPSHVPNNAGFILAHPPPPLPLSGQQLQNPGLKGAFVGSPIIPNMHLGTVLQPPNFGRTSAAEGAPTIIVKAPGFPPPIDVQFRPSQDVRSSARPNYVASAPPSANAKRPNDGAPRPLHLKVGSSAQTVSGNGNVQSVMSAHGHWVWQPGPQVDLSRKENLHFVSHHLPSFPGLTYGNGQPVNPSVVHGNTLQLSGNGTTIPDSQGVTLRLGSPGPHLGGGQKH